MPKAGGTAELGMWGMPLSKRNKLPTQLSTFGAVAADGKSKDMEFLRNMPVPGLPADGDDGEEDLVGSRKDRKESAGFLAGIFDTPSRTGAQGPSLEEDGIKQ